MSFSFLLPPSFFCPFLFCLMVLFFLFPLESPFLVFGFYPHGCFYLVVFAFCFCGSFSCFSSCLLFFAGRVVVVCDSIVFLLLFVLFLLLLWGFVLVLMLLGVFSSLFSLFSVCLVACCRIWSNSWFISCLFRNFHSACILIPHPMFFLLFLFSCSWVFCLRWGVLSFIFLCSFLFRCAFLLQKINVFCKDCFPPQCNLFGILLLLACGLLLCLFFERVCLLDFPFR